MASTRANPSLQISPRDGHVGGSPVLGQLCSYRRCIPTATISRMRFSRLQVRHRGWNSQPSSLYSPTSYKGNGTPHRRPSSMPADWTSNPGPAVGTGDAYASVAEQLIQKDIDTFFANRFGVVLSSRHCWNHSSLYSLTLPTSCRLRCTRLFWTTG